MCAHHIEIRITYVFTCNNICQDPSRLFENEAQSSRKRRITRNGTHVFSLGRMFFARREFGVRMFF